MEWNTRSDGLAPPPLLDRARDALFLDFDGTLVPIAERPDAIAPDRLLPPLIARLRAALQGRVVIVSGRRISDLDHYLQSTGLLAAGLHGAEMRGTEPHEMHPDIHRALARARTDVSRNGGGLHIEDKGLAIALHFRARPELQVLAEKLAARAARESEGLLEVQPGNMVVELRPCGADKGSALQAFLKEPLFAGARPIFAGDDLTDEAGFDVARQAGGHGIIVGARQPTGAHYALPDPAAVHRWLIASLEDMTA
ncbi:MAG: trehalose-phosphatase [Alphaproteobacteria bacterium]|nr:trehalose-phosphatase [Alphaproteobacteria bacterium]